MLAPDAPLATGNVMPTAYHFCVLVIAAVGPLSTEGRSPCQPDMTTVMPCFIKKPLPAPTPATTPDAAAGMTGAVLSNKLFDDPSLRASSELVLVRLLTMYSKLPLALLASAGVRMTTSNL